MNSNEVGFEGLTRKDLEGLEDLYTVKTLSVELIRAEYHVKTAEADIILHELECLQEDAMLIRNKIAYIELRDGSSDNDDNDGTRATTHAEFSTMCYGH